MLIVRYILPRFFSVRIFFICLSEKILKITFLEVFWNNKANNFFKSLSLKGSGIAKTNVKTCFKGHTFYLIGLFSLV